MTENRSLSNSEYRPIQMLVIPIPLPSGQVAYIRIPSRMTEIEWDSMMEVIETYQRVTLRLADYRQGQVVRLRDTLLRMVASGE